LDQARRHPREAKRGRSRWAAASGVGIIVTGDGDLLMLGPLVGGMIVTPRRFLTVRPK
jgi:hypothetical protein